MLAQLGLVCEMRTFRNEIKRDSKSDQIDWYSSKIWKLFFTCFHLHFWGSSSWWCRWARSICPCRRGLGLGDRSLLLPEQSLGLEHSSILRDPGSSCERDSKASMEIPCANCTVEGIGIRVTMSCTELPKFCRSSCWKQHHPVSFCTNIRPEQNSGLRWIAWSRTTLLSTICTQFIQNAWTGSTCLDVMPGLCRNQTGRHSHWDAFVDCEQSRNMGQQPSLVYVKVQYFPSSQSHSACDACSDCTSEDTSPKNHLSKKAALAWCLVLPCVLLSASLRAVYGFFVKVYTFRFSKPGIFQNFTRTWLSDVRS